MAWPSDIGSWAGRSVLVTGAGGFVGSHLVHGLLERGAQVTAWVRGGSGAHAWRLAALDVARYASRFSMVRVDVSDASSVRHGLVNARPSFVPFDTVYHLAAQAHVGECWERPSEAIRTNVEGTANLLAALAHKDAPPARVIIAGSSEEYGRAAEGGNDARTGLEPRSLYAATKVAQDQLGLVYWRAFRLGCIIARPHNIYGPMQGARYVTPTIITQALGGAVRLGAPDPRRDFTYVGDAVQAYLLLGLHGKPGEVYGWGVGKSWSIAEWADLAIDAVRDITHHRVGSMEVRWNSAGRGRPGASEVVDLVANAEAVRAMGWNPRVTPEEGLRATAAWYAAHRPLWEGETE